jgi:polyisoprenyl-teichoic acid--peptidoglycan teichoic acid transferase
MSQSSMPNHRPSGRRSLLSGLLLGGLLTVFVAMFAYVAYLFISWGQAEAQQMPDMPALELPKIVRPASEQNTQPAAAQIPFLRQAVRSSQQEEALPSVKRTTVLLLGVDARPGQKIARTDSIILLTFNPQTNSAGMLSIPRDLKVRPSALNRDMKITSVYPAGEAVGYPGGGAALLEDTITELLGYPIDQYVIVNFEGFKQIIDLIGGVDITVPYEIYDDKYPDDNYGYLPPVHFLPGKQHMDGDTALKYARTRHADNDYARAGRQQQVIMAIKDKITQQGQLGSLLPRLPGLAVGMANSVQTDIPVDKAITLARIMDKMDLNNIARVVVNQKMGTVIQNDPTLGYTLVPDLPKVRAAADAIFADQVAGPTPAEVQRQTIQAEGARIVLLNGTQEKGLASRVQAKLVPQGYDVTTVGNADRADYSKSALIIYGESKQATVDALMTWFGISEDRVTTQPAAEDKDIAVIVGSDQSQVSATASK